MTYLKRSGSLLLSFTLGLVVFSGLRPLGAWGAAQLRPAAAPELDVAFVPNAGQFDPRVAFRTHTIAGTAFVSRTGDLVYALPPADGQSAGWSLVEHFGERAAVPTGAVPAAARVSYITAQHRDAEPLATWRELQLGEVAPGIEVRLRAVHANVEKIFRVRPGAAVGDIQVALRGAQSLAVTDAGALRAMTGNGPVEFAAPVAYQEIGGRRHPVTVAYTAAGGAYGFRVGAYDRARELVIDPVIQSTYLGTSGTGNTAEVVTEVRIDPTTGEVYATGLIFGADFPGTTGGARPTAGGGAREAFVARLSADLRTLIQATYLGGSNNDEGTGLALGAGSVFVTGFTGSADFPVTAGAAQGTLPTTGANASFIARLNPALTSLVAATYYGGTTAGQRTELSDVLVHPNGDIYVCGITQNTALPATSGAVVSAYPTGTNSAVVARLNAALTTVVRSTYNIGNSACTSISVIPTSGELLMTSRGGTTPINVASGGIPTFAFNGTSRGWVSRLSADLTAVPVSTYTGSGTLGALQALVNPVNGDIYVMSHIQDDGAIPASVVAGGAQTSCNGPSQKDCLLITRFTPTLNTLVRGTLYGNGSSTTGTSLIPRGTNHMVLHPVTGDVFVSGEAGPGMPNTAGSFQPTLLSGVFTPSVVVRIAADLATIVRASYVTDRRKNVSERLKALALHPLNNDLYIAGSHAGTGSLPATTGGAQPTLNAGHDGFIMRVTADLLGGGSPGVLQFNAATYSVAEGGGSLTVAVTRSGGTSGAVSVQYATANGSAAAPGDFTAASGTLNWADGDSANKTFVIPIIDDTTVESAESATVALSGASGGATIGTQSSATFTINDNDVAPPTTPGIAVSGSSVSYAAANVGVASSAQTVTITSNGTAPLVLGTLALGGTNAGDFSITANTCNGQTLVPNASCTVQVVFTPSAAGTRTATLSVPSNAAGSPATVTLTGTVNVVTPPANSGDRTPSGGGGAFDVLGATLLFVLLSLTLAMRGRRTPAAAAALAMGALVAAGAARAGEWQAGIDYLHTRFSDTAGIGSLSLPNAAHADVEKSGDGYGLRLGYRFSPHVGIEAGYRDLGRSALRDVLAGGNPVTLDIRLRTSGIDAALYGEWATPSGWFAQLRGGVFSSRVTLEASNGRREVQSANKPYVGVAAGREFGGAWRVQLSWDGLRTGAFSPAPGFVQDLGDGKAGVLGLGFRSRL